MDKLIFFCKDYKHKEGIEPIILIVGSIPSRFRKYKEKLLEEEKKLKSIGYVCYNPASFPDVKDWRITTKTSFTIMEEGEVQCIYVPKGFKDLTGAREEIEYAKRHQIPVFYE